MAEIELNQQELAIITDHALMHAKVSAISKIQELFSIVREQLKQAIVQYPPDLLPEGAIKTGKISRGENYLGLPYLVLDYPAIFSTDDIFAYRTMFWWGHFFSCTLQIQGKYLNRYRQGALKAFDFFRGEEVYLCTGSSPWQYHYGQDNYTLLQQISPNLLTSLPFLKISKKMDLGDYRNVPDFALKFFDRVAQMLGSAERK